MQAAHSHQVICVDTDGKNKTSLLLTTTRTFLLFIQPVRHKFPEEAEGCEDPG